ncbi:MAG: phosphoketolase family protein [Azovibrio sp.]|nr:phosphoketolase family protein [Azovibrio sp.]
MPNNSQPNLPALAPASEEALQALDAWWRAANYLAGAMIYLQANPLLERPLQVEDIKQRPLGHWGSSPGLSFIYAHLTRLIRAADLNAILLAGPGHGAPGILGPAWLEGSINERDPARGWGREGLRRFCRDFSFPGGMGSHCTPETPGSIHEGGELGYSLSHAFGAAFDNPDLLVSVVVGDGEAETGPLATAWHSNKFLNPAHDGAVLPILHLNGYKIANPTVLARIPRAELIALFQGYGWQPLLVAGDEPMPMHRAMAAAMDQCLADIRAIQHAARHGTGTPTRPRWPMIILISPKGWTGPKTADGHAVEGTWRAHQVPLPDPRRHPEHLHQLTQWLLGYQPASLFTPAGEPNAALQAFSASGERRLGMNPHANGGLLRRPLRRPDWRQHAVPVSQPASDEAENTDPLGHYLAELIRRNPDNFRLFGPDETASNRLGAVYAVTGKAWLGETRPADEDGSHLSPTGRVMEMLSEHTLEGWLEGYLLTGRHGLLSTYEAFAHVIDSMFNQHAKWLEMCRQIAWRAPISALNLLITSTVWRQDHNGFTHQDPGFLDLVVNKSPAVTRIYLPPDANCLLAIADRCLDETDVVNVIVADKQRHLQFLDASAAARHCERGIGLWDWASSDDESASEPEIVLASCGDVATQEALAAAELLYQHFPDLKLRFVNVVDLFTLTPPEEHPHGISERDWLSLFTHDKPIVFCFHGYPWLIHRLAYRRPNHDNLHVRGYKERGSINTPLELAIANQIDRYSLAIDVIDRVPRLAVAGAHAKQALYEQQQSCLEHAHEHGIDAPEVTNWRWQAVV